jgi:hypothetical protein
VFMLRKCDLSPGVWAPSFCCGNCDVGSPSVVELPCSCEAALGCLRREFVVRVSWMLAVCLSGGRFTPEEVGVDSGPVPAAGKWRI